jgi:hypothetical protein
MSLTVHEFIQYKAFLGWKNRNSINEEKDYLTVLNDPIIKYSAMYCRYLDRKWEAFLGVNKIQDTFKRIIDDNNLSKIKWQKIKNVDPTFRTPHNKIGDLCIIILIA